MAGQIIVIIDPRARISVPTKDQLPKDVRHLALMVQDDDWPSDPAGIDALVQKLGALVIEASNEMPTE